MTTSHPTPERKCCEKCILTIDGIKVGSNHNLCKDCPCHTTPPAPVPYHKIDHIHCWAKDNPGCGIPGKHRCCLCEEPAPAERTCNKCGGELLLGDKFKCTCLERSPDASWPAPVPEWESSFNLQWSEDDVPRLRSFAKEFIAQTLKSQATQPMEVVEKMKSQTFPRMGYTGEKAVRTKTLDAVLSELKKLI